MALKITYRENHVSFGAMLLSGQTLDLALAGAERGATAAREYASKAGLPADYISGISVRQGPVVALGKRGNPRHTARLVASHPLSAALEFGTGVKGKGASGKTPRPQGGYSAAYRILGRAGSRLGSRPIGGSE